MEIHHAGTTSLLVVALIGMLGFASHQIGNNLSDILPLLSFARGGDRRGIVGRDVGS